MAGHLDPKLVVKKEGENDFTPIGGMLINSALKQSQIICAHTHQNVLNFQQKRCIPLFYQRKQQRKQRRNKETAKTIKTKKTKKKAAAITTITTTTQTKMHKQAYHFMLHACSYVLAKPAEPEPPASYIYKDLENVEHGPFTFEQMAGWCTAKFFTGDLLVKKRTAKSASDVFRAISDLAEFGFYFKPEVTQFHVYLLLTSFKLAAQVYPTGDFSQITGLPNGILLSLLP